MPILTANLRRPEEQQSRDNGEREKPISMNIMSIHREASSGEKIGWLVLLLGEYGGCRTCLITPEETGGRDVCEHIVKSDERELAAKFAPDIANVRVFDEAETKKRIGREIARRVLSGEMDADCAGEALITINGAHGEAKITAAMVYIGLCDPALIARSEHPVITSLITDWMPFAKESAEQIASRKG